MSSAITPQRIEMAIQNRFNPIRNFTPRKLARQIDQFKAGNLSEAALTWDAMENRDPCLLNVAQKRKKACARLPFKIEVTDDSAEAKAQAEVLTRFYNSLKATSVLEQNEQGGLNLLIRQMMDSVGKRFAVHEIVWKPSATGLQAEFRFCPLWWFENRSGRLRYLPMDGFATGEEMLPFEWLVTVGEGLMEASSVLYTFKHMPLKDWVRFSEKFGMPGVIGKTSAAPDSDQWNAMVDAVKSVINDWAGVTSIGDSIELLEVKSGGANLPFPALVEYCDRMLASLWRGADLSTISQGNQGVGASLQGDETDLLLEDDAQNISETLNEQVDRFVIAHAFGPEAEVKAYFKLLGDAEDGELTAFKREVWRAYQTLSSTGNVTANLIDLKALARDSGLTVNEEYDEPYLPVVSPSGMPVTGATRQDSEGDIVGGDAEGLSGQENGTPGGDGKRKVSAANERVESRDGCATEDSELVENALAEALGVRSKWLAPIKPLINELIVALKDESKSDAAVLEFLEASAKRLPELLGDMDFSALAEVLEKGMGPEVVHGIKDAIRTTSPVGPQTSKGGAQ